MILTKRTFCSSFLICLLFLLTELSAQPCSTFTLINGNPNLEGWEAVNVYATAIAPGTTSDPTDRGLGSADPEGNSWLYNETDFSGNWIADHGNIRLCWDNTYGGLIGPNEDRPPIVSVYQGNPDNPDLAATFTGPDLIPSPEWDQVCVDIVHCGDVPPGWEFDGDYSDWVGLFTNVTGLRFNVDDIYNIFLDNICMEYLPSCEIMAECDNFNNASTGNWDVQAGSKSIDVSGPSGAANDMFAKTQDGYGHSYFYNDVDYQGNWLEMYGNAQICWDFQILEGLHPDSLFFPEVSIYSGGIMWPSGSAKFVSSEGISTEDGWVNFCVDVFSCGEISDGWEIGGDNNNWVDLLSNVTGIRFLIEFTGGSFVEVTGFDNICVDVLPPCPIVESCGGFDDGMAGNWIVDPGSLSMETSGPSGQPNDFYLNTYDGYGHTYLYNTVDYQGNWIETYGNVQICWDNAITDGVDPTTLKKPNITIFQGHHIWTTARATFESPQAISIEDGWVTTCVNINNCGEIPKGWKFEGDYEDWIDLLSNVSGIRFDVEILDGNFAEQSGFDNICFDTLPPCPEFCIADFSLIQQSNCLYEFLNMSSVSVGDEIIETAWTFGDGGSSQAISPWYAYDQPGTFEVCLTILTSNGCKDEYCEKITVDCKDESKLFVDFTNIPCKEAPSAEESKIVCFGCFEAIAFVLSPIEEITSYEWNLNPGNNVQYGPNFSSSFSAGVTYTLCLTVTTNLGNSASVCKEFSCSSAFKNTEEAKERSSHILHSTNSFTVYPNPSPDGLFRIQADDSMIGNSFRILDIQGKNVYEDIIHHREETIDVSHLNQGMYILKVDRPDSEPVLISILH